MSGDHNMYQKTKSYLNDDFECPRCGHCCLQQTKQEPVATVTSESGNPNLSMSWWHEPALPVGTKIYTSPPKAAEWVGLTADEIWKCNKAKSGSAVEFHICSAHQNVEDFAEAIEAKLKEKNA